MTSNLRSGEPIPVPTGPQPTDPKPDTKPDSSQGGPHSRRVNLA
jgi:hypothetical protein